MLGVAFVPIRGTTDTGRPLVAAIGVSVGVKAVALEEGVTNKLKDLGYGFGL